MLQKFVKFSQTVILLPLLILITSGIASFVPLILGIYVFPHNWAPLIYCGTLFLTFACIGLVMNLMSKWQWKGFFTAFISILTLTFGNVGYWIEEIHDLKLEKHVGIEVTEVDPSWQESLIQPLPYELDLSKIDFDTEYHPLTGMNPNSYCKIYFAAPLCSKLKGCAETLWSVGWLRRNSCSPYPKDADAWKSPWLRKVTNPDDKIVGLLQKQSGTPLPANLVLLEPASAPFESFNAMQSQWLENMRLIVGLLYLFTSIEVIISSFKNHSQQ